MNILDNSLLTVLITLAAIFLGLSIVVQVIQELYKYVRSSKGRTYQLALLDFLGPIAYDLTRPGVLSDIRVRGPFQLRRIRPEGLILPLEREELVTALERTAPAWIQRTLKQLNLEAEYQNSSPSEPSQSWNEFLKDLGKTEQGALGYWNAFEIAEFLEEWKYKWKPETHKDRPEIKLIGKLAPPRGTMDANKLLLAFRKKFLPHVENASDNFSKLNSNFEYTYQRSNRRLTFIIALIVTIFFNLPIDELYQKARKVDAEQAIKLAETTMEFYKTTKELPDSLVADKVELVEKLLSETLITQSDSESNKPLINLTVIPNPIAWDFKFLLYMFYCIITAIFITFGAPFWNDLASALLRLQKQGLSNKNASGREVNNG